MINIKKIKPVIISCVIALAVGGASALLTMDGMEAFQKINQPFLSPPPIVFSIVWSILYLLMGISSGLIYNSNNDEKKPALTLYGISLVVNFFWSIFFFCGKWYLFSFFWLILLLVLVVITVVKYFDINHLAAYLQIPYIAWLCFAAYLNIMVYILNK